MHHICSRMKPIPIVDQLRSEKVFMLAAYSLSAGLYFPHFPVLMSGGAILLFVSGLMQVNGSTTLRNPYFMAVSFLFLLMLISLPYTDNTHDWLSETQRKLSFLLIAYGMAANKASINKKNAAIMGLFFLGATIPVSLLTLGNYIAHMEEYNSKILQSQGIPIVTGISHITYSILCTFAIGLCYYFYRNASLFFTGKIFTKKYIYAFTGAVLFVVFHIISSRTGWVALYLAIMALIAQYIWVSKKYLQGLLIFIFLGTAPLLAYHFSVSFHNKILNTIDDVSRYLNGDYIGYYSVSMRFEAWEACYRLFINHPWLGVGSADLGAAMQGEYDLMHTSGYARVAEAHNQFLEYAACNGLPGILGLLSLFVLLFRKQGYRYSLLLFFGAACFGAFIFESFLEIQVGVAFFSLYYMLFNLLKENNELVV